MTQTKTTKKRLIIGLGIILVLMVTNNWANEQTFKVCWFAYFNDLLALDNERLERCYKIGTVFHRSYLRSIPLVFIWVFWPTIPEGWSKTAMGVFVAIWAGFLIECILILNQASGWPKVALLGATTLFAWFMIFKVSRWIR